jgi:hypothetical protein
MARIDGLQEHAEMTYDEFINYSRSDELCIITDSSTVVNTKIVNTISGDGSEVTVVTGDSIIVQPGSEVVIRDTANYNGRFTVTIVDSPTQFRYSDTTNSGVQSGTLNVVDSSKDNLIAYRTQLGVIKFIGESGESEGLLYLKDGSSIGSIHSDDGSGSSIPSIDSPYSVKLGNITNTISTSESAFIGNGKDNSINLSENSNVFGSLNRIDKTFYPFDLVNNSILGGKLSSILDSNMANVSGYMNTINGSDNSAIVGGRNNSIGYSFSISEIDVANNRIYIRTNQEIVYSIINDGSLPFNLDVGLYDIELKNYLDDSKILDKEYILRGDKGDYNLPDTFYIKSVDPNGYYITISETLGGSTFQITGTSTNIEMVIESNNVIDVTSSLFIYGGYDNSIKSGFNNSLHGGHINTINNSWTSSITSGTTNSINNGTGVDILGGKFNVSSGSYSSTIINGLNNRILGNSGGGAPSGVTGHSTILVGKHNTIKDTSSSSILSSQYSEINGHGTSDYNSILSSMQSKIVNDEVVLLYNADTTQLDGTSIQSGQLRWNVPSNQSTSTQLFISGFRENIGSILYLEYYGHYIEHILGSYNRDITISDGISTQVWTVNSNTLSVNRSGPDKDIVSATLDVTLVSSTGEISNNSNLSVTIPVSGEWMTGNTIIGGARNLISGDVSNGTIFGMENTISSYGSYVSNSTILGRNNYIVGSGTALTIMGEGNSIRGVNNFSSLVVGRDNEVRSSMQGGNIVFGQNHRVIGIQHSSAILSGNHNYLGSVDNGLIAGGRGNQVNMSGAILYGEYNVSFGTGKSVILTGINNFLNSPSQSFIGSGKHNEIFELVNSSSILSGNQGSVGRYKAQMSYGHIGTGNQNVVSGDYSSIHNGANNTVLNAFYSDITNGYANKIKSDITSLPVNSYNDNTSNGRIEITSTAHGLSTGDIIRFYAKDSSHNAYINYYGPIVSTGNDNFHFEREDAPLMAYNVNVSSGTTVTIKISDHVDAFNLNDVLEFLTTDSNRMSVSVTSISFDLERLGPTNTYLDNDDTTSFKVTTLVCSIVSNLNLSNGNHPNIPLINTTSGNNSATNFELYVSQSVSNSIISGKFNEIDSTSNSTVSGIKHKVDGSYIVNIDGENNFMNSSELSNLSGENNTITNSIFGVVTGGNGNFVNSTFGLIANGNDNAIGEFEANGVSPQFASIINGANHYVSASFSTVLGGFDNKINNTGTSVQHAAIISGTSNTIDAYGSVIIGGTGNNINTNASDSIIGVASTSTINMGQRNAIICGIDNSIDGAPGSIANAIIGGGSNNAIAGGSDVQNTGIFTGSNNNIASGTLNSVIVAGQGNSISNSNGSNASFIGAGIGNNVGSEASVIVGGGSCAINGAPGMVAYGFIGGGFTNTITSNTNSTYAVIAGGNSNAISEEGQYSVITGGVSNTIGVSGGAISNKSFIGGGESNEITSSLSSIIGGVLNKTSTFDNVHLIGSNIDLSTLTGAAANGTYMEALVVGTPTGGHKGAGTINATAVYDDNVLLTDYVFEKYYDGEVIDEDRKDYEMKSLEEEIAFTQDNKHLSTIIGRKEWEENGSASTGEIISQLWETVETQFLYIKELKEEIDKLKGN